LGLQLQKQKVWKDVFCGAMGNAQDRYKILLCNFTGAKNSRMWEKTWWFFHNFLQPSHSLTLSLYLDDATWVLTDDATWVFKIWVCKSANLLHQKRKKKGEIAKLHQLPNFFNTKKTQTFCSR
jgi:hypothetical protein